MLPLAIGFGALVVEFGQGLLVKAQNQRVADAAAYAAALAYNATSSSTTMTSTAAAVAALNGVATSGVSASLVGSPSGDGNQAVSVTISSADLMFLAPVLGFNKQLPVSAASYAELSPQASGCIIGLSSSGTGVALSGGANVTAAGCAVSSNAAVSAPCGTTITTKKVTYDSSAPPSEPCGGIKPPSGVSSVQIIKAATTDPLASNSEVSSSVARLASVSSLTSPSAPTVPTGGTIDFAWNPSSTQSQAAADGCSASFSGSTWTLTCPNGGTYNFQNITIGGGITLNFNTSGSSSTTYDFSGYIINSGTAMSFGSGTFNIAQGLYTGGGSKTAFGSGTFDIGPYSSSCNGSGAYSICNTGTSLTFGGPSTFVLSSGVYNSGGSTLTLGAGSTNSFKLGAGSSGNAIYMGGGAVTTFADALGGSSLFTVAGNVDVASGGGSCLTISAAAQHDINGFFASGGGTILGAGVYTINGYIGLGANGGGDVTCNGVTVGVSGSNVTLVTSGAHAPTSGTCANEAFCLAAGYSNVSLTAPTTGATTNLLVVGPTSSTNTEGAAFAEGASNTSFSGAFYFPWGPITLSGGASVGSGSGQCLELIGSQITASGGTAAGSTCISGTGSTASVLLVQ